MKSGLKVTLFSLAGLLAALCVLVFLRRSAELPRDSGKPSSTGTAISKASRTEKEVDSAPAAAKEEVKESVSVAPEDFRVAVAGRVVEEGSGRPIRGARVGAEDRIVLTTEDGEFRTEPLDIGRIPLTFAASGFATRELTFCLDAEHEPRIVVELPRGGAIEGVVTLPDGEPAAGAEVRCSGKYVTVSTEAGTDGKYRLEGILITRRNFEVYSAIEAHEKTVEVVGFRPGEANISLDIELEQNPDFKPTEKIDLRGRVIDSSGAPVGGAQLYLRLDDDPAPDAVTDSLGNFIVKGANDYDDLIARKRGLAPSFLDLVELPAEERNAIEIVLGPGQTIAGVVVDGRERPVQDAQVDFSSERYFSSFPEEYATGADGTFRIEDLPRTLQGIRVSQSGFLESEETLAGKDIEHLKIVLAEAGQIQGIVVDRTTGNPVQTFAIAIGDSGEALFSSVDGSFTLKEELAPGTSYNLAVRAKGFLRAPVERAEAWPITESHDPIRIEMDPGRSLSAKVIDSATGKAVDGVRAIFHPEAGSMDWILQEDPWDVDSFAPATMTDDGGNFTLRGLPDSFGKLLLDKPGYARTVFPKILSGSAPGVFQLPRESIVEGTVKSRSGDPLAKAEVSVWTEEGLFAGTTNSEGRYRVEGLPPGEANLDAKSHGLMNISRKVVLHSAVTETVDLKEAGGSIRGKVTLRGKPVSFVTVSVSGFNGEFQVTSVDTDEHGIFRIAGLNPGTYRIAVREAAPRPVKVEDGEVYIEIILPAQRVSGRVVDRTSGKEIDNAIAVLHLTPPWMSRPEGLRSTEDEGKEGTMSDSDDDDSRFLFDGVPPGKFYVFAFSPSRESLSGLLGPLELLEGGDLNDLVIKLDMGTDLALKVLDARTRSPVEGATVSVVVDRAVPHFRFREKTDADGLATLSGVTRGSHRLKVDAEGYFGSQESIEITRPNVESTIHLQPAPVIRVELEDPNSTGHVYELTLTALQGGDPGWGWRSIEGNQAVHFDRGLGFDSRDRTARVKTRAGRYRIRAEVTPLFQLSRDLVYPPARPVLTEEIEVTVPETGEATLRLKLPLEQK